MTLLLALAMPLAHARCARPAALFSSTDSEVREDPTLYFFRPGNGPEEVRFVAQDEDGALPVEAERVRGAPDVDTWRVTVDTRRQGPVTLEARWDTSWGTETVEGTVSVVAGLAPPEATETVVTDAGTTHRRWTCSHQDSRDLDVVAPRASALRVTWAASERDFERGEVQSLVLADHPRRFWGTAPTGQRVELGYLNCFGETFEWRQPSVFLTITPLYADGTEGPTSAVRRIARP